MHQALTSSLVLTALSVLFQSVTPSNNSQDLSVPPTAAGSAT